jgi:ATP-GRASP peptide maturase of grasp-with-spasm system
MSEYDDNTTVLVCQWLIYYDVPFVRIDLEEQYFVSLVQIENELNEIVLTSQSSKKIIKLSEIKSVWYRRGELNLYSPDLDFINDPKLKSEIKHYLFREKSTIEHLFYYLMANKPHIGTFHVRSVNKLRVLIEASNLGIKIPKTIIAQNKKELIGRINEPMITKAIYEGFKPESIGKFISYTEMVGFEDIPDKFSPSLFQEKIEKEADIRIFYLFGTFFSMAIRSQASEQTKTDFRKYLKEVGNRCFPFKLPNELELKLDTLMKKIELNTGSIDMIMTEEGDFVFLEVNPVGQFGMTSLPCNYYLEKEVASKLVVFSNQ